MSENLVSTHQEDRVRFLTICRESKLNALNARVIEEMTAAIAAAKDDPDTRCVVITGAGSRAFVAGADIVEIRELEDSDMAAFLDKGHSLMNSIENLGKPVIAAINGYALGGGFELALACTIRIAAHSAQVGLPEVNLGLLPGYGGTQRLSRLIGPARALHLTLTGAPVNADTALSWGMVTEVVEADELQERVAKLATKLARSAPLAVAAIIETIQAGNDLELEQGLELEKQKFAEMCRSSDMREGTGAFLEKRRADFTGR